jgi:Dullard-like phosphatase family protein
MAKTNDQGYSMPNPQEGTGKISMSQRFKYHMDTTKGTRSQSNDPVLKKYAPSANEVIPRETRPKQPGQGHNESFETRKILGVPLSEAYFMKKLYRQIRFNLTDPTSLLLKNQTQDFYEQLHTLSQTPRLPAPPPSKNLSFLKNFTSSPKKKLLILDLDETLIHSKTFAELSSPTTPLPSFKPDKTLSIPLSPSHTVKLYIWYRPYLFQFLQQISKFYTIAVFTASSRNYAIPMLDLLDPQRQYIKAGFYREDCTKTKTKYLVKDLRIFCSKSVKLEDIIIVDNSANCFWGN